MRIDPHVTNESSTNPHVSNELLVLKLAWNKFVLDRSPLGSFGQAELRAHLTERLRHTNAARQEGDASTGIGRGLLAIHNAILSIKAHKLMSCRLKSGRVHLLRSAFS